MKHLTLIVLTVTAVFLVACSSIDCPIETKVVVNYSVPDTLRYDTLTITTRKANGTDSVLQNRLVGRVAFSLPVSYSQPADTLVFHIADTLGLTTTDTVWMQKLNIPHFESIDCAAHFFHHITDVQYTRRGIDTLFILNPTVNYDTKVNHLQIHFKSRY